MRASAGLLGSVIGWAGVPRSAELVMVSAHGGDPVTEKLYEPEIYHTIAPPRGLEGFVGHDVDFNALPASVRQRLVGLLEGEPTTLPRWLGYGGQGCSPVLLMGMAAPAGLFLLAVAFFFVFSYADYRIPRAPLIFPFFLVGLGVFVVFPLVGWRKRAVGELRPYKHDRAYLLTARHVVWVDGDKVTVADLDPARLYVADVVDSKTKAVRGAYVKVQMGSARTARDDVSMGSFSARGQAEERLRLLQEDMNARRAALRDALARGDAAASGELDPFWEVGDRWAELQAAGAPATCAEGPAIERARPVPPLVNYAPLLGLAPVLLGSCCFSGAASYCAHVFAYLEARRDGTPAAYRAYLDKRPSWFDDSAHEELAGAVEEEILRIRRETLGEPAYSRQADLEELLKKYPSGKHAKALEAEIERLDRLGGERLTLEHGAVGPRDGPEAATSVAHVKVGQRYVFSMAGSRQVWTITGVEGDVVQFEAHDEARGKRAASDWRAAEESEPSHGESLGEKEQRFGDQRLRLRGWRTSSGSSTLETWVSFDEAGVVFPGKVLITRDGEAKVELIEVLDPKD